MCMCLCMCLCVCVCMLRETFDFGKSTDYLLPDTINHDIVVALNSCSFSFLEKYIV